MTSFNQSNAAYAFNLSLDNYGMYSYCIFKRIIFILMQTVKNLITCRVQEWLVYNCTACQCALYKTQVRNGVMVIFFSNWTCIFQYWYVKSVCKLKKTKRQIFYHAIRYGGKDRANDFRVTRQNDLLHVSVL